MYTDFRLAHRDNWTFFYMGKELMEGAKRKLKATSQAEKEARDRLVALVKDPGISASDKKIQAVKSEIESVAEIREKLIVFVHEFARNPAKEYQLHIGDVVFFDLVDTTLIAE